MILYLEMYVPKRKPTHEYPAWYFYVPLSWIWDFDGTTYSGNIG